MSTALPIILAVLLGAPPGQGVSVQLIEGIPDAKSWNLPAVEPTETYDEPAFGLVAVPKKYSPRGILVDRSNPFLVRAQATVSLPAGEYRVLLRSHGAARLAVDERVLITTSFLNPNASGHESVPEAAPEPEQGVPPLPAGHQERVVAFRTAGGPHVFRVETFVGGQKLRPELGELVVAFAPLGGHFHVLSPGDAVPFAEESWARYAGERTAAHHRRDDASRRRRAASEKQYWDGRHNLARAEWAQRPALVVPTVSPQVPVHNDIDRFIGARLEAKHAAPAPLADDASFLRRVTLDTVGVIPTPGEIRAFQADRSPDHRAHVIDRLLADERWADHWVAYWQDVLAENPGILKPTLNNTGPFRWWLSDAFRDNLPMDRFVTELVLMEGSKMGGGPAGFGMATQNDAPMAAKGQILAKAFLGIELQCARCHDAPFHPYKQKDVFSLAALLARGPQTVPATSSVRVAERTRRPLITVTLEPGAKVAAEWPFADLATPELPPGVVRNEKDPRERLAALLTSPRNERFAEVLVNRLWKRYLGWGLVEPVDDWLDPQPSHPELLQYLARELVTHDYDLKHVARLILLSHTYQRAVLPAGEQRPEPGERLFASPARRRLSAEQLVDSLFLAAGKEFGCEELTMDPEGRRPASEMINLGRPRRAWEFTSLSNERDRPALSLPVAQGVVDLLSAFGWRDSRQNPVTVREDVATPLQPLLLANGVVGARVSGLSDDSAFTRLALESATTSELVERVFVRILSRAPSAEERRVYEELLRPGFADRRTSATDTASAKRKPAQTKAVSWSNHLSPEATRIKLELERAARAGDPPTERLHAAWRERLEDMVWSLLNSPEFAFVP